MFARVAFCLALAVARASPAAELLESDADIARAHTKVPGDAFRGEGHVGMVAALNRALRRQAAAGGGAPVAPCESFTAGALADTLKILLAARDERFDLIYRAASDNRRLRLDSAAAYVARWAEEEAAVSGFAPLEEAVRDARCHDAVMWWVHHVAAEKKEELGALVTLPLLPATAGKGPRTRNTLARAARALGAPEAAGALAYETYEVSITCNACHASGQQALNSESTIWPDELSYTATGYGAFPFWDNTGAGCTYCDPSIDNASTLMVKYSATLNHELLMHSRCGDMSWTGDANAPNGSPCNHLFNSDYGAFIYTPKAALEPEADGAFCCRTYAAGDANFPGAVPKDWARSMNYWGNNTGFVGDYYSGEIKIYWSNAGGVDFWYYEDADGNPVEQGEGCYFPGVNPKEACAYEAPIVVFHDYDPDTFLETKHTADEFALPAVCANTTVSCAAPGGSPAAARYMPVLTAVARGAGVGPR